MRALMHIMMRAMVHIMMRITMHIMMHITTTRFINLFLFPLSV